MGRGPESGGGLAGGGLEAVGEGEPGGGGFVDNRAVTTEVVITGGAGQIGYQLAPLIASGQTFGERRAVHLRLLELPGAMQVAEGVAAELQDGAFPNLAGVEIHDDPREAFEGATHVFMVGAKPRQAGKDRSDLLVANAGIFKDQGIALGGADNNVRVLVVGNPANSNALVTAAWAPPEISQRGNITAMSRLDHNRAQGLAAAALHLPVHSISHLAIWGNHSDSMVVDTRLAQADGTPLEEAFQEAGIDLDWYIEKIVKRGSEIINLKGSSSAMSAARAASEHMHDWELGTDSRFTSAAVLSHGEYGMPQDVYASMPVTTEGGPGEPKEFNVVYGLEHPWKDPQIKQGIEATGEELLAERAALEQADFLPS